MLPFQVGVALLAFTTASILVLSRGIPVVASYHVIFAIGIMPLILAAMSHFVPVLARSKNPGQLIGLLPVNALFGGMLVVGYLAFPHAVPAGHYMGAAITMMAVAILGWWTYRLRSNAIGSPHPCLDWYLAALVCLLMAIAAILAAYWLPEQRPALRLLHLHFNTLGFVGITAFGTLQVLLPTVTQKPDPDAAMRMRRQLKWMVAGTVLTSCGAAWHNSLSWIGATLLVTPVLGALKAWSRLYVTDVFKLHGTAPALAAALCGYLITVVLGALHATPVPSIIPAAAFIIAFLMPLVTGAASHLLPLWLRPGQQTTWHQAARKQLGAWGGLRAALFLSSGLLASLGYTAGWYLAALAATTLVLQLLMLFTGTEK